MGAFFIVRHGVWPDTERVTARLRDSFVRQGFASPKKIAAPGCDIYLYAKIRVPGFQDFERDAHNYACFTGTALYRGKSGAMAAAELFEHFALDAPGWLELSGNFCAILCREGAVHLFTDRLGTYKVYRDADSGVFSSSFLAVLDSIDKPTVNTQSVYEYVFQGATYGNETVVSEIQLVDCAGAVHLNHAASFKPWPHHSPPEFDPAPLELHLQRNLSNLRQSYSTIQACYGDCIDTALSGGYDSRLTLALLREQGVTPKIHVYGGDDDEDVRVARHIAQREGLALDHVDKSRFPPVAIDEFAAVVERNYQTLDGLPSDGIFDNGSDVATRLDRCAEGELMLNGGGGEIFRNFFYLPNFRFSLRQFLWSFYSRFDPGTCTKRFSDVKYLSALGKKITAVFNHDHASLSRAEVEYLYPAFRCRFWMGKNNSNNNRLGWALTPFIDCAIVEDAARIPLAYKNHGRFEAALIRAVSPSLARYSSVYGHNFTEEPPLSRIIKDLTTYVRPPIVRRYTYRIQMRRAKLQSRYLGDDHVKTVLDLRFPYLSLFVRVHRINDPGAYNRICTLEYLFQRCQPEVAES